MELQLDHIIPVSMGGATSESNLQILCSTCNRQKEPPSSDTGTGHPMVARYDRFVSNVHQHPAKGRDNPWSTYPDRRTVLAITHNVTAASRLFDTLPLLASDPRIRIIFTPTGSSAFDDGTTEFLAARGVTQIPWRAALSREFDLAVSASYGGNLHRIRAPLFVVPHGMGYNKYLEQKNKRTKEQKNKRTKEQKNKRTKEQKNKRTKEQSVFGLSPEWLLHNGAVVPSVIVLSHLEQLERLRRACPEAAARALVAGDICFDRLRASRPLRAAYRQALGVRAGQKLVVISSTWGPDSLLATHPDLPRKVAEALPVDEFKLMMALHPNIGSNHSRWQVMEYLSACERAGAYIPEDIDEWRVGIIASDITIGDQGSVPFYSAALGNPLILATAPSHTVDPRSPIARLMAVVPQLDMTGDITDQIRRVIAEHDPGHYSGITALTTSEPDHSAAALRSAMYKVLRLVEPRDPAEISALPLPTHPIIGADSHLVHVESATDGAATIARFPADRLFSDSETPRGSHLAVGVREPRKRWVELADVIIGAAGYDTDHWIVDTLSRLPGCALATAPTPQRHWLLGDRTHRLLRIDGSESGCRLFASVAYKRLQSGHDIDTLVGDWTVECAGRQHRVGVTRVAPVTR